MSCLNESIFSVYKVEHIHHLGELFVWYCEEVELLFFLVMMGKENQLETANYGVNDRSNKDMQVTYHAS